MILLPNYLTMRHFFNIVYIIYLINVVIVYIVYVCPSIRSIICLHKTLYYKMLINIIHVFHFANPMTYIGHQALTIRRLNCCSVCGIQGLRPSSFWLSGLRDFFVHVYNLGGERIFFTKWTYIHIIVTVAYNRSKILVW